MGGADAIGGTNFFGVKDCPSGGTGSQSSVTSEFVNGSPVSVTDDFCTFATPEEGFRVGYVNFLRENSRYSEAFKYSHDSHTFLTKVWEAGYATDPDYVEKVWPIAVSIQEYVASKNLFPPVSEVQYDTWSGPEKSPAAMDDGTCNAASSAGSQDIMAALEELAWPDPNHGQDNSEAKPEQKEAFVKVFGKQPGVADNGWSELSDCCKFVFTVLGYTGILPDAGQKYKPSGSLYNDPEPFGPKFEEINNKGNTSDHQPGDILVSAGHCWFYGGDNIKIDASWGGHVAYTDTNFGYSLTNPYRAFRYRGGN